MVLAHRERLTPRLGQRELAAQRMREWSETGKPLVPLPAPGVYARHNAVDTPALLPDGSPAESSVSRVLAARGTIRQASTLADDIEELTREMRTDGVVPPSGEGESAPAAEDDRGLRADETDGGDRA
jgi:NADH-quinone oxidoreductase subunit J